MKPYYQGGSGGDGGDTGQHLAPQGVGGGREALEAKCILYSSHKVQLYLS